MTKQPWRTKDKDNRQIKTAKRPGECTSIDTLESCTSGLIAQILGFLTKKRYKYTTVFVNHYSDLTFVHHHISNTGKAILKAKHSYEAYAASLGARDGKHGVDEGNEDGDPEPLDDYGHAEGKPEGEPAPAGRPRRER